MNRFIKTVLGITALAGLVVVILAVLVKVFVTPERVKAVVLPLAEQALHRQIELGEVKVGLFSGIELHDLAVSDPGETEPFVASDLVVLRFQWLPLLARQVVIDEVRLERPMIRVIRRTDGTLSIDDLLGAAAGLPSVQDPSAGRDASFSVLVTKAHVLDGRLVFADRQVQSVSELRELQLDASGISLDGGIPVKLSARLQGAPLQLDGIARPLQKGGAFHLSLQGLDALTFEPYFRDRLPGKLSRLLVDLQGDFDLQERTIAGKGSLVGRELTLQLPAKPEATLENASVKINFDLSYQPEHDHLAVTTLAIDANGIAAQIDGTVTALKALPQGDLKVIVPDLDLKVLNSALSPALLGKASELDLAGKLRGSVRLIGPLHRPLQAFDSGELTLDKVQATVAGLRPSIDGRIVLAGTSARIETMSVTLGEVAAMVAGQIDRLFDVPVAALDVTLPRVELGKALAAAPKESLKGVAALAPGGEIEGRARLAGPLASPATLLKSAEVTLSKVQVTIAGQRPEFDGTLRLNGDQLVSEQLNARLGENTARLEIAARNLFGRPVVVRADVTSRRFLLEPLLQGGGAAAAATTDTATASPRAAATVETSTLPLQASGTVRIGETLWKGLTVEDFIGEYALRDNRLTVGRMTGRLVGGTFNGTGHIDLRHPQLAYDATLALQGVQADPLLTALAPSASGTLSGAMTLTSAFTGSGTGWDQLRRTLSGEGTVAFADGKLVSPELVKGLAAYLQIPNLSEIPFRDFRGKAKIANGKAEIDSTLLGRQLKVFAKGTLGLDGSLNLAMDTRLHPELTARIDRRGQVTRYLHDTEGWSQVPLLVTGTVSLPRFGLDPKGVQAQATRALQEGVQRGLDRLLPKPPPADQAPAAEPAPGEEPQPAPPPASPPGDPARQLLEESLKQLLNR